MSQEYPELGWTIEEWRGAFVSRRIGIRQIESWFRAISSTDPAWIYLASWEEVRARYEALLTRMESLGADAVSLPLAGVPFAVKDNIDVAGFPTTAACPAFRYVASVDATVVERLQEAGAIVIGKTNMDQFATGLVGTRSPYGVVPSAFRSEYISGGSSSGSARVVTAGIVPFSLGTDTAGSGRVPAAFGNIVGLKPTRGTFSTSGVVPACRTLDCVSVFALTVADAAEVSNLLRKFDDRDPYSRQFPEFQPGGLSESPRIGVLDPLEFYSDSAAERAYQESLQRLIADGFVTTQVSSVPFYELAKLLYAGPWVAERSLVAGRLLEEAPAAMDPVVAGILRPAREWSAEEAFRAEYRRAELAAQIQRSFADLDAILVPTTATIYTIAEVREDPVKTNARLGTYTNFTNLSDLCGVAVPGRFREDGLPTGLTFLGPAFSDERLLKLGARAHAAMEVPLGATGRALSRERGKSSAAFRPKETELVKVAVVGAHLSGMALNSQLTARGARLVAATTTAERYRLFLLPGSQPLKPALMRVEKGFAIALEVWELEVAAFGELVLDVPPPLGIGSVQLADDSWVKGFICEPWGLEGAEEISAYGGFAAYLEARQPSSV